MNGVNYSYTAPAYTFRNRLTGLPFIAYARKKYDPDNAHARDFFESMNARMASADKVGA